MAKTRATSAKKGKGPARKRFVPPLAATVALLPIAIWMALTPYVAPSFGWGLELGPRGPMLEVVDHVVPAIVVGMAAAAVLLRRRKGATPMSFAVVGGVSLLGGLWSFATHVPLLGQAGQGLVTWGAALFHSAASPVLVAVALAVLVPSLRAVD